MIYLFTSFMQKYCTDTCVQNFVHKTLLKVEAQTLKYSNIKDRDLNITFLWG